jgi:hypothetical protein
MHRAFSTLPRAKFIGKVVEGASCDPCCAAEAKLAKFLTVADSLAKIAVVVISIYGAIYLFITDVARQCTTVTEGLYKLAQDDGFPTDLQVINTLVQTADPGHCKLVEKGVSRALAAISQVRQGSNSPPPTPDKSKPLQGAVAVGFVDSDWIFDYVNGSTDRSGVKKGALLRARTDVNVRPGAADWTRVVGVLHVGQCFRVDEDGTLLKAGTRSQIWAKGSQAGCS